MRTSRSDRPRAAPLGSHDGPDGSGARPSAPGAGAAAPPPAAARAPPPQRPRRADSMASRIGPSMAVSTRRGRARPRRPRDGRATFAEPANRCGRARRSPVSGCAAVRRPRRRAGARIEQRCSAARRGPACERNGRPVGGPGRCAPVRGRARRARHLREDRVVRHDDAAERGHRSGQETYDLRAARGDGSVARRGRVR